MSAVWQCGRCFALHFSGERICRRCGASRPIPSVPATEGVEAREPETLNLHLPPTDFPYSRRARTRERWRIGPAVFFALALLFAIGWDPFVRRVAAARALGGESPAAVEARRLELVATHGQPGTDPTEWRAEARALGARWRLDGDARSHSLGELEVRVRALWLNVASLPDDASAVGPYVSLARAELSRVTEDLSHAR